MPDVSFAGLPLMTMIGHTDILGDLHQYHIFDSAGVARSYVFINDSLHQYIKLTSFPGGSLESFDRIEVGYTKDLPSEGHINHHRFAVFTSESGVRLGMSRAELVKIKGSPPHITKTSSGELYTYKITDIAKSPFLQKYHMPEYTAAFSFTKDKLTDYDFGFPYP